MPSSPLIEESNLITFDILSNGSKIPDSYEIISINTEQFVNRIATAEIILSDGNFTEQSFSISESETFIPGAEIEIKLGYQSKNETVFKGIVVKQLIKIAETEGTRLQVICKDRALKMTINRSSTVFTDQTDSDIIKKLVEENNLSYDIASTNFKHKEMVQYHASDWDFIVTRAEANGMVVLTDKGKFIVTNPNISSTPELQVTFGYDIIDFEGELDATNQYSETKGIAWDMSSQNLIEASGTEPSINSQGDISGKKLASVLSKGTRNRNSSPDNSKTDIKKWADAALIKSRLSRFKGAIRFQGSAKAKANSLIKLLGLGNRFNGDAFITGVTHLVEDGLWNTEVKLGLSQEWYIEKHAVTAPKASGLVPGINGLQTGIVKNTFNDPDNQFRVQVEIPILGEDAGLVWARLSTFYSGNGTGAFFIPEIGDEVLLGFMNDDPRFPIILGSVYSSSNLAPETPNENNSIKTIKTKSELELKFDDTKKSFTIQTPGGNTMVFSDEDGTIKIMDQNKNKIEMSSNGISLESAKNINIKATQDVTIKGANVITKGDQSVSVSSGEVSIKGDISTSIKGSAECSISSDGNLTAKGLMVMIN